MLRVTECMSNNSQSISLSEELVAENVLHQRIIVLLCSSRLDGIEWVHNVGEAACSRSTTDWQDTEFESDLRQAEAAARKVQSIGEISSVVTEHTDVLGRLERECCIVVLQEYDTSCAKLTDEFGVIVTHVDAGWTNGEVEVGIGLCFQLALLRHRTGSHYSPFQ